jgi:tRNA pseudouridine55 synthase
MADINEPHGFLCVDKPAGITSHDVVAAARKTLHTKKVGHAGTLDPFATGLLVLGIGKATKLLQYIVDGEKEYVATIRLGATTHSDDFTGEFLSQVDADQLRDISDEKITEALKGFVGTILQKPSSVSAIKVDGKRAYDLVREGKEVDLPARSVTIHSIEIKKITHLLGNRREKREGEISSNASTACYVDDFIEAPAIDIEVVVRCEAGTYIRSIARDLGERLGVGGYLTTLRRTLVSPFTLDNAYLVNDRRIATLESIKNESPLEASDIQLIPISKGLNGCMPLRTLTFDEIHEISFGRFISSNEGDGVVCAVDASGEALALLKNKDGHAAPINVFSVRG